MSDAKSPREAFLRARIYRVLAMVFGVGGLMVFVMLYASNIEGRVFEALRDPWIIAIVIVPFLPAVVLSFLAQKYERQCTKLLGAAKK